MEVCTYCRLIVLMKDLVWYWEQPYHRACYLTVKIGVKP